MSKLEPLLCLVALCVACGSRFEAGGAGSAGAGQAGSAAERGGDANLAGTASGGSAGALGAGTGGTISEAGSTSAGGAGAGAGGEPGAGSGGSPDCEALKVDYRAAVEKARVCQKGVANQCSTSSTLPGISCGCPVLVNAKSAFTAAAQQKYQAFRDAKCDGGLICETSCLPPPGAACASQPMISGNLTLCTASVLAN